MLPTLNEHGDVVVLEPFSKVRRKFGKGDVVIGYSNGDHVELICKRITATVDDFELFFFFVVVVGAAS